MEVISVLESVQKGMKDNIYNFCKDGKCSQCGNCCSNLLPMSRKEVDATDISVRTISKSANIFFPLRIERMI